MSFYEAQSWQLPMSQGSWEQPAPPSRSGTSSAMQQEGASAFDVQIEEVDRALDNLSKSGKLFNAPSRRDSMPMIGGVRPYAEFDQRMSGIAPRHHSISDYEQMRSHSGSNLQNFYANQRHQPRPSEAEQMMQVKRKMAAQRERELRNYHQEQKSARANSPASMNEEERRTLIARQHRALYGDSAASFYDNAGTGNESSTPRPQGSNASNSAGPSPLTYDPFGLGQNQGQASHMENAGQFNPVEQTQSNAPAGPSPKPQPQQQQRSRANSTSSPASNNQSFSLFESAAQQSSRTSTSSPGGSPPRQAKTSVAPIGTGVIGSRPAQAQGLNKRSTTPLPSPLSYGFAPNENANANERSTSAASNPSAATAKDSTPWGGNWGGKNNLGVQQSVWG